MTAKEEKKKRRKKTVDIDEAGVQVGDEKMLSVTNG